MGKVVPDFSAPAPPQQGGQSRTGTAAARFPGGGCPQQSHGAAGRLFLSVHGIGGAGWAAGAPPHASLRISGSSGPPLPRSSPFSFPSAHRQNRSRISVTASRRADTQATAPLVSIRADQSWSSTRCLFVEDLQKQGPGAGRHAEETGQPCPVPARLSPGEIHRWDAPGGQAQQQAPQVHPSVPHFIRPFCVLALLSSHRSPPKGRPFLRGPFFSAGSNSLIGPCAPPSGLCVGAGPAPPSHWTGPAEGAPSGQPASSNSTRITSPSRNWSTMTSSRPLFSRPAPM